jgi:dihydroflavonol-4-reductase
MTTALVTGATGCVGANVVEALLEEGYQVRALRRTTSRLAALEGLSPSFVTGDVLDASSLREAMEGCDVVFHVAAVSQYWRSDLRSLYAVNVLGTRNVLATAKTLGVSRVVLTSSAATLGVPTEARPILDERSPYNRHAREFHYAHSKVLAEAEMRRALSQGQDVVCVNPSIVIGRRDINFVGGEILRAANKGWLLIITPGGTGVVSAQAVGRGHVLAAERGQCGERYVLNGENVSHWDLASLCASLTGRHPPVAVLPKGVVRTVAAVGRMGMRLLGRPYPGVLAQIDISARFLYYDASKAVSDLGWAPLDAQTAVEEAWCWYRRQGLL